MKVSSFVALLSAYFMFFPANGIANRVEDKYKYEKENDVQLRTGIAFEKKLSQRFSLALNEELRMKDNVSNIDRLCTDLNASFKIASWLKVNAAYTLISLSHKNKKSSGNQWNFRHRATAGFTLSYQVIDNLTLSLKERVQMTHYAHQHFDNREKRSPQWGMKSKIQVEYKCRQCPLVPFTYVELCNTLNAPKLTEGNYIDKVRSGLGTTFRLDKKNSITFLYRFDYVLEKKVKVKKSTGHLKTLMHHKEYNNVFSIAYKFKF